MKLTESTDKIYMSHVISALSHALDLTEGQPLGHSIRCSWIGLNIGMELNFSNSQLVDLYYAILLKDAGCSSNASRIYEIFGADDITNKRDVKTVDIQKKTKVAGFVLTHIGKSENNINALYRVIDLIVNGEKLANELISIRCERGAEIAEMLGLNQNVSSGIYSLDEHWNGNGRSEGLKGEKIPMISRIALTSQVADVFNSYNGKEEAVTAVRERSGRWFDPAVVEAFISAADNPGFWTTLTSNNIEEKAQGMLSEDKIYELNESNLDKIAVAFARIIDAKSPYTAEHSSNVADISKFIAQEMNLSDDRCKWVYRGALLHDIGKLGISNEILDKKGKLTDEEFNLLKMHPVYTEQILSRFMPFGNMAKFASAHHERLDGKGYPNGISADDIALETRIITVSDIFNALIEDRSYRKGMSVEMALDTMNEMIDCAIDSRCLEALKKGIPQLELSG